jgi:RNA recognition motif-containing protein
MDVEQDSKNIASNKNGDINIIPPKQPTQPNKPRRTFRKRRNFRNSLGRQNYAGNRRNISRNNNNNVQRRNNTGNRQNNLRRGNKLRLFVRNISKNASNTDLKKIFEKIGPLRRCGINWNELGESKGTADVEYIYNRDTYRAWRRLDYKNIKNVPIRIELKGGSQRLKERLANNNNNRRSLGRKLFRNRNNNNNGNRRRRQLGNRNNGRRNNNSMRGRRRTNFKRYNNN